MLDIKACDHRWPSILEAIGVDRAVLNKRNQPCPFCGGEDRFRFIDHNGWGTWVCNACQPNPGNGFSFVQRWLNGGPAEAAREIGRVLPEATKSSAPKIADRRQEMRRRWMGAHRVTEGDPVWAYLKNRRVAPDLQDMPTTIRYAPDEPYFENGTMTGKHPAMFSLVQDCYGRGATLHVTYIDHGGHKANVRSPRKVLSAPGDRPAIRLFAPVGGKLAVCEGVETSLAVHRLFGIPVWALMNATNMSKWRPPEGVELVQIYGDTDSSFTGQLAAYTLAQALRRDGITVEVNLLDEPDTDYADIV